jgi:hypothetical protein
MPRTKTPTITDGQEGARSSSEGAATTHGDSGAPESQWEAVIDRATD